MSMETNTGSTFVAASPSRFSQATARMGLGAFGVSLIVHAVFVILAIFVLYKWVQPAPPEPQVTEWANHKTGGGNGAETLHKVAKAQKARIASSKPPVIVANRPDSSIPLSEREPSLGAALPMVALSGGGGGPGKGAGIHGGPGGDGFGVIGTPGKGVPIQINPFGSKENNGSALSGHFYDFKQDEKGKEIKYDLRNYDEFLSRVKKLQRANFRESAFRNYFKAPDPLFLSQIAIPFGNASEGPIVFGVADKVKPSGWLVHYRGTVVAPRDITFRFAGMGDDYISAFVGGRPKLIAGWPGSGSQAADGWDKQEPIGAHKSPLGDQPLTYGDWIRLKKGEKMELDLAIGECPGGKMGFILMIEEKGVTYEMSGGRPILPLFTTEVIRPERKAQIVKGFGSYEFEWENVPVFAPEGSRKNDFGL